MDVDSQDSHTALWGESVEESRGRSSQPLGEEQESDGELDPRTLYTYEQLTYLQKIFDSIDYAKREHIPSKSIGYALRIMGQNPTKANLKKYINIADPDKTGLISFLSFITPLHDIIDNVPENHMDIIAAFEKLDEEDLQYLTVEFLTEMLTTYGEDFDDIELEIFFKAADPKNTGKVNYRDFVEKIFGITKKVAKKQKKGKQGKGKPKKKPKPKK